MDTPAPIEHLRTLCAPDSPPAPLLDPTCFDHIDPDDGRCYVFGDLRLVEPGDMPYLPHQPGALIPVLMGGDGEAYAIWREGDAALEACPVVFLCDEGSDDHVLAGSLEGFLRLAAIGEPRVALQSFEAMARGEYTPDLLDHRKCALFARWSITPCPAPVEAIRAAQEAHPGFRAWRDAR